MTEMLAHSFLGLSGCDTIVSMLQLLSKPENCCGLKESEVLSLLSDVGMCLQRLQ